MFTAAWLYWNGNDGEYLSVLTRRRGLLGAENLWEITAGCGAAGINVRGAVFTQDYHTQLNTRTKQGPTGMYVGRIPQENPTKSSTSEKPDLWASPAEVQFVGGKWKDLGEPNVP